jgi:hypothetical protein
MNNNQFNELNIALARTDIECLELHQDVNRISLPDLFEQFLMTGPLEIWTCIH